MGIRTTRASGTAATVVIVIQEFESHLRAIQQVALGLTSMDYRVLIAAPAKLKDLIETVYGLEFVEAGTEWATPDVGAELADQLKRNGNPGFVRTIIKKHLCGEHARKKLKDLAAIVKAFDIETIFSDITDIPGQVFALREGLQCVRLENGWLPQLTQYPEALETGLTSLWGKTIATRFLEYKPPALAPIPKSLLYAHLDYVQDYLVEHPQRANRSLPAWVGTIPPDRPVILGTYGGSILTRNEHFRGIIGGFNRNLVRALRDIPCTGILSVGPANVQHIKDTYRAEFGEDIPPHVRLVGHFEQPLFLERVQVAAMLHAGGLGTDKEQIANGVPSVIVKSWSEGEYVADRFERAGISTSVLPTAEPNEIADATLRLLTEDHKRNARLWQHKAAALPTLQARLRHLLAS